MRPAGLVCWDLGTSVKHAKNQLRDYMESIVMPHCDAGIPARRAENLPCNCDCQASPASQANTFPSLNFASKQNGSPEDRYFSFYITHKALSDHKTT